MINKRLYILFIIIAASFIYGKHAFASNLDGNSYYVMAFDFNQASLQQFTWMFTDNATSGDADNATDSDSDNASSSGSISITQPGKTFENSSGSYISTGSTFNGTWDASEEYDSSYYGETIYTYYTFLFFGMALADNSFVAGTVYSTTRTESDANGSEETTGFMFYAGILVSTSRQLK